MLEPVHEPHEVRLWLAAAASFLVVLGLLDHATGNELRLSLLYIVPVAAVAWTSGTSRAVIMGVAAAAVRTGAARVGEGEIHDPGAFAVNVVVRVALLVGVAVVVVLVRDAYARSEARRLELERALAEVKTLRGLLPICSGCKKIRDDQGYWRKLEEYLTSHTEATFTHGLCRECIWRLYPAQAARLFPESKPSGAPAAGISPGAPAAPPAGPTPDPAGC